MIIDFEDEFTTSGGQAVTADAIGTKYKNAGTGKTRDWGRGEAVYPYARITGTADSNPTTSETVDIVAADNALLTTNPVVLSTVTILAAAALANTVHAMPALLGGHQKQYLGCRFVNAGGAPSTGEWIVGLAHKSARPQNDVAQL
jgi:hypothetical protein